MQGMTFKVEGDTLTVTCKLTERHGLSESGKTELIASSAGPIRLDGKHSGIAFGFNVYTKTLSAEALAERKARVAA